MRKGSCPVHSHHHPGLAWGTYGNCIFTVGHFLHRHAQADREGPSIYLGATVNVLPWKGTQDALIGGRWHLGNRFQ
jgi:hypothetical protein